MQAKPLKALLLLAMVAVSLSLVYSDVSLAQPAAALTSVAVDEPLPMTDPEDALWATAAQVTVPLTGQLTTLPIRPEASAPSVRVRALHNATHIAFHVSWDDPTENVRSTRAHEFRDAVAIMLGPAGLTGICMGSRGEEAHIAQWKADWQADIDEGFHDLHDAFPNFWVDTYPWAVGDPPYALPEAFPDEAKDLLVGWDVGNPFSQPLKATPVEDAVATGFGTIATQDRQDVIGRGVWAGSGWSVVIARRLDTGDAEDQALAPGGRYHIAFAVWDGAEGDVGARKSVSSFVTLEVGAAPVGGLASAWVVALVLVPPAAAAGLIFLTWRYRRG